jgi:hypothetical protein
MRPPSRAGERKLLRHFYALPPEAALRVFYHTGPDTCYNAMRSSQWLKSLFYEHARFPRRANVLDKDWGTCLFPTPAPDRSVLPPKQVQLCESVEINAHASARTQTGTALANSFPLYSDPWATLHTSLRPTSPSPPQGRTAFRVCGARGMSTPPTRSAALLSGLASSLPETPRLSWLIQLQNEGRLMLIMGLPRGPTGRRCMWLIILANPWLRELLVRPHARSTMGVHIVSPP